MFLEMLMIRMYASFHTSPSQTNISFQKTNEPCSINAARSGGNGAWYVCMRRFTHLHHIPIYLCNRQKKHVVVTPRKVAGMVHDTSPLVHVTVISYIHALYMCYESHASHMYDTCMHLRTFSRCDSSHMWYEPRERYWERYMWYQSTRTCASYHTYWHESLSYHMYWYESHLWPVSHASLQVTHWSWEGYMWYASTRTCAWYHMYWLEPHLWHVSIQVTFWSWEGYIWYHSTRTCASYHTYWYESHLWPVSHASNQVTSEFWERYIRYASHVSFSRSFYPNQQKQKRATPPTSPIRVARMIRTLIIHKFFF